MGRSKMVNQVKVLWVTAFILLGLATRGAASFTPEIKETSGSQNFKGLDVSLDLKGTLDDLDPFSEKKASSSKEGPGSRREDMEEPSEKGTISFKPDFLRYKSDTSSDTIKTNSARLGFANPFVNAGLSGGNSPEVDKYKSHNFGTDLSLSFYPGAWSLGQLKNEDSDFRIDLGGGYTDTTDIDDYKGFVLKKFRRLPKPILVRKDKEITLHQKDVDATAAMSAFDVTLSGQYTQSHYDKDVDQIAVRTSKAVRLAGINSLVDGFPDKSLNVRADISVFPIVSPYVSFTRTQFKVDTLPSKIYDFGAYVDIKRVRLEFVYEKMTQEGSANTELTTIGASYRF